MINIGVGAYIHCYQYDCPTIAAIKAIQYAPYYPENDKKISSVINFSVPRRTSTNGETTDGSK